MTSAGGSVEEDALASRIWHIERNIALLDACAPENREQERRRVVAAWQGGQESRPLWMLRSRGDLRRLREELDDVMLQAEDHPLRALYQARVTELVLEVRLVEARGTSAFRELALERYPITTEEAEAAGELAREWSSQEAGGLDREDADDRVSSPSCSAAHLIAAFERRLEALGISAELVLRRDLASVAAVGDGVVFVSEGARLTEEQVERVVLHELEGHLLPRWNARREFCGIFRVGSAGSGEDEEGRALLLERRAGFLSAESPWGRKRRRELALRHRAAQAVREGADFVDLMRSLLAWGETPKEAYAVGERVLRGGGLAREIGYLPALLRVEQAFSEEPKLEGWLSRGRVSIAAARWLARYGEPAPDVG